MKVHYLNKEDKGTTFYMVLNRWERLFGIRYKTLPAVYQEGVGYVVGMKRMWFKYKQPIISFHE